jgi:NTP pyrophosphatase (non-canonical NTP hydrolase)
MRIYVGTTFARYAEARAVVDVLTAAGHEITLDWTRTSEFDADGHPRSDVPPLVEAAHAQADLDAVARAELVLVLAEEASCGWPIEVGAALAWGTARVWVVAPFRHTVFWRLPQVEVFDDLAQALRRLAPHVDHAPALAAPGRGRAAERIADRLTELDGLDRGDRYTQMMRVTKLAEEVGEVAEALIAYHGVNPRKEPGSLADVLKELSDVAVAAKVSIENFGVDSDAAVAAREQQVLERLAAIPAVVA